MATIVKLTYTLTGKATLVNLDGMTSAFRIFEKTTRKYATRLNFGTEHYVVVDEELQEIMKLSQSAEQGEFQSTDWVQVDEGTFGGDFDNNFEDRMRDDFNRGHQQQRRPYQQRQPYYNSRY